ncbi:hypothetical protein ACQP3J_31625 [Escherichia coli]
MVSEDWNGGMMRYFVRQDKGREGELGLKYKKKKINEIKKLISKQIEQKEGELSKPGKQSE